MTKKTKNGDKVGAKLNPPRPWKLAKDKDVISDNEWPFPKEGTSEEELNEDLSNPTRWPFPTGRKPE